MNRYLSIALLTAAAVLGIPAALQSQVFGIPTSNRTIEGTLIFSDNSTARFEVREGTMLTVRYEDAQGYAFSPLILDSGEVEFMVYEIQVRPEGEYASEVGQILGGVGATLSPATVPAIDIVVERLGERRFSLEAPKDPAAMTAADLYNTFAFSGTCCITCNGRTTCACSVTTSCGSCCAGDCCGGSGGSSYPQKSP